MEILKYITGFWKRAMSPSGYYLIEEIISLTKCENGVYIVTRICQYPNRDDRPYDTETKIFNNYDTAFIWYETYSNKLLKNMKSLNVVR